MPDGSIGILGGVFNPPHNGHCALARLALEHFNLRFLYFVPTGTPPHKSREIIVPARHRLAMVRLALKGEPGMKIYGKEIRNRGISYTVDTVAALARRHPGSRLILIIGSDNLREIRTWRRYREILDTVTLGVAHRPGFSGVPLEMAGARIEPVPSPEWGISSSMIRSYLERGHRCRFLLPDAVSGYIAAHGLYQTGA